MAKGKEYALGPSNDTIIDVVRTMGEEVRIKQMSYGSWLVFKKESGYVYRAYEVGRHSFVDNFKKK